LPNPVAVRRDLDVLRRRILDCLVWVHELWHARDSGIAIGLGEGSRITVTQLAYALSNDGTVNGSGNESSVVTTTPCVLKVFIRVGFHDVPRYFLVDADVPGAPIDAEEDSDLLVRLVEEDRDGRLTTSVCAENEAGKDDRLPACAMTTSVPASIRPLTLRRCVYLELHRNNKELRCSQRISEPIHIRCEFRESLQHLGGHGIGSVRDPFGCERWVVPVGNR
jgi:hypothetical protein